MKIPKIPCGKVLGHGEYCCVGYLCDQCTTIKSLLNKIKEIKGGDNNGKH